MLRLIRGGAPRGRGGLEFASSSDGFFKYTFRHIHHILTFHTYKDTWPVAFYLG